MKTCTGCKQEFPIDEFNIDKTHKDGRSSRCTPCKLESQRKSRQKKPELYRAIAAGYRERNPEKHKNSSFKSTHKITYDEFLEKLESQGNVCAICGTDDLGKKKIVLDHDHNCCGKNRSCPKCHRGVLCQGCNKIFGFAKDNVEVLAKAIEYLEKYERNKVWE